MQRIINIKGGMIKIDDLKEINFDKDYVHAPDTSLYIGFDKGKISKEVAFTANQNAGFKFFKIIEADASLYLPNMPEIKI